MPKLLLLADSMVHNESEIESRHGRLLRVYLQEVESTNTFATQLIRSESENFDKKSGFLVVTSNQISGRGQREKNWDSSANQDLAMTWVVMNPPKVDATVFNMAAALATSKGIRNAVLKEYEVKIPKASLSVKWPNDVMFWSSTEWRKVAGILIENQWRGESWTSSLVGIGVNVQSRRVSKSYNAVSISEVLGIELKPEDLELPIIEILLDYTKLLNEEGGTEKVVEQFNSELYSVGETREFIVKGVSHSGVLLKIDSNGMGEFDWKSDNPPKSNLHSSEVQWVFGLHSI